MWGALPALRFSLAVVLQVALINFTVTSDGLQQQLLGEVVRHEIPETEQRNTDTLVQMTKDKRMLKQLVRASNKLLIRGMLLGEVYSLALV